MYWYNGAMVSPYRLNANDPLPLHAQLERAIKLAVIGGGLKIGDRLPTVRQMAVDLRINANTVARVYAELERQGILATRRGVGTFVQALPRPSPVPRGKRGQQLSTLAERFLAEAAGQGFSPHELLEQVRQFCLNIQENSDAQD
jgi:GntR family transcriptional regulator